MVFGTILDPYETFRDGSIVLDSDDESAPLEAAFETGLRPLLGRFVGVLHCGSGARVYTDPIGALPVVFDRNCRTVASSPLAIPGVTHEERFRQDLYDSIKWPLVSRGDNTWIPGTVTYYDGVERVLPNHYLDLRMWDSRRFWPSEPVTRSPEALEARVESIVGHLRSVFDYIDDTYANPQLSLTAGKDSRTLLATAKPLAKAGRIGMFTIGDSDWEVDRHIAQRITRELGLRWTPLSVIESSAREERTWSEQTGYTVGSAVKETYTTMWQLDADAEIGGLGGEIGRSYLWQDGDDSDTEIGPRDILTRYNKPDHPALAASLEPWFEGVSQFDTYTTLDLAHQEHRLGNWAGPQHLGFRPTVDHIRPYCFRPIIETTHRLDPDWRHADQLPHRIIGQCWPELEQFPYNSFTDWKRHAVKVKKAVGMLESAAANPDIAAAYLSRKYRGR